MIITLSEVKTLLQIGSSYDTLINALLPIIEDQIIDYTKNNFTKGDGIVKSTLSFYTHSITDSTLGFDTTYWKPGQSIRVDGTDDNDGTYNIDSVSTSAIIVLEDLITETEGNPIQIRKVQYPKGLKLIASDMIKFNLSTSKAGSGIKSESIDDYSVTFDECKNAYPMRIWQSLNKYSKYYKEGM